MATKPPPSLPPPPPQRQPVDFFTIITESKRIIKTHLRHFLALSLIFLLPNSISPFITPQNPTLLLLLLISSFSIFFSLLATGSIAYSAYHAFYERPINVIQSIKSSLSSFFPLLFTFFLAQILASSILLAAGILFLLAAGFLLFLLFLVFQIQIQIDSPNYLTTSIFVVVLVLFFVVLVYFYINYYGLAHMVVVVESKWGLDAFRRSHHLMKGMKKLGLSLLLYYGLFTGLFVWYTTARRGDKSWRGWEYVIFHVLAITCVMMVSLSNIVSFTVFYIHCKAKDVDGGGGSDEEEENNAKEPLLASAV